MLILDYGEDEWAAESSIPKFPYYPTIYNGNEAKSPKLSAIHTLLYNMGAQLAGVAAGYDVRVSNVSPLHPSLDPR